MALKGEEMLEHPTNEFFVLKKTSGKHLGHLEIVCSLGKRTNDNGHPKTKNTTTCSIHLQICVIVLGGVVPNKKTGRGGNMLAMLR